MKLKLVNVKVNNKLSEETTFFSATIYANDKKAGEVSNRGRGGRHSYHWNDPELGRQIEDWANTQPTKHNFEKLDQLVDDILTHTEILASITRRTKKVTWFRLKGDKKGEWRVIKTPYAPDVKKFITDKYPTLDIIANEDLNAAVAHC